MVPCTGNWNFEQVFSSFLPEDSQVLDQVFDAGMILSAAMKKENKENICNNSNDGNNNNISITIYIALTQLQSDSPNKNKEQNNINNK